jgi:hypothetical protein
MTEMNGGRESRRSRPTLVCSAIDDASKAVLLHAMVALGGRGGIAPSHS